MALATVLSLGTDPGEPGQLVARLLRNVHDNPGAAKYRRLRLHNSALRQALVETDGPLDLFLALGFQLRPGTDEDGGFVELPMEADLSLLTAVHERLQQASVEAEVPGWFFERTGVELKAAFQVALRKREQDKILMTREMRERLAAKNRGPDKDHAVVRVRFPEGISLQGEFGAEEPAARVLTWVTESLADPLNTFQLGMPGARAARLEPGPGQTVRGAGLVPSIVLNFRWTGESERLMKNTPSLRMELLRGAQASS